MRNKLPLFCMAFFVFLIFDSDKIVIAQDYVGSNTCIGCHTGLTPDIVNEYQKTGHPYKLNPVMGGPPVYPANTSPGVPEPPAGTTWDDFAYVIGGYGWKARWVKTDGRVFTANDSAQYNLDDQSWVEYNLGQDLKYNYACFQCHTTGASEEGSWNEIALDSLGTFSEPGIRCEGCHGPGSAHAADPSNVKPPNQGEVLTIDRCGDCHQRGGTTNAIPASGLYIRHHEQLNEMRASKHGDGMNAELTCASCHNPHVTVVYPEAAGEGMTGITTKCQTCHPNQEIDLNGSPKPIDCVDCHMPQASKSALGMAVGNGWKGDVKTHIMGINTAAVTREAMFTMDGSLVQLDGNGLAAVTLDFVCLSCHTNQDVAWAAGYADDIHTNGIMTGIHDVAAIPTQFRLSQNHPNPFNPTTTIDFSLPKTSQVNLSVYSITGQLIMRLVDNKLPAGDHSVKLSAEGLASGIYIYTIRTETFTSSRKMMLMK
ncbi:MAG: T9SS type A sorting domain-containing protein [Calditrichaceae bacterium]